MVAERDAWRCWLCDEPVDPSASANADRGASIDSGAAPKGKKAPLGAERLAHRACNTRKGAVKPFVPWSPEPLRRGASPDRGDRCAVDPQGRPRGGGTLPQLGRDAEKAAGWLLDRLSRFAPEPGGDYAGRGWWRAVPLGCCAPFERSLAGRLWAKATQSLPEGHRVCWTWGRTTAGVAGWRAETASAQSPTPKIRVPRRRA